MQIRTLCCLGLALIGCSGAPEAEREPTEPRSAAIVGGTSARNRDPAVVAIDIGGIGLCTGSLIAPHWVLTARHCVSRTVEEVECPARSPQIGEDLPADTFTVLVGNDERTASPVAIGKRVLVPQSDVLCDHDLALLELDRDVTGIETLALASLSGLSTVRGVGFGKRGDTLSAGKKMTRSGVKILARSKSEFEVGVLSCNGDSGGPALDAKGRIVGVVSRGGPGCNGPDSRSVYTRVDAFRSFIAQAR